MERFRLRGHFATVLAACTAVLVVYASVARVIGRLATPVVDGLNVVAQRERTRTPRQAEAGGVEPAPGEQEAGVVPSTATSTGSVKRILSPEGLVVRFALVAVVAGAVLYAGALGVAHVVGQAAPTSTPTPNALAEGVALGGTAAPTFSLQDQHGTTVSLDQFRGHPIVLTFFDSLCPHADCSLMAQYINWTAKDMGADSGKVAWVALSVNPWHDTPATATTFLATREVTIPLHYLLGTPAQMQPLWQAYHMQAILQANGIVIHSTGVYVIDASGREQLYLDEGFDPQALSAYLSNMLKNGGAAVGSGTGTTGGTTAGTTLITRQVNGYWVNFAAQPGQYGTYTFSVTLEDGQHTPIQGAKVGLDLAMTSMAMSPVHVDLSPIQQGIPGSYQAPGVVSMLGAWRAKATITLPGVAKPLTTSFDFNAKY